MIDRQQNASVRELRVERNLPRDIHGERHLTEAHIGDRSPHDVGEWRRGDGVGNHHLKVFRVCMCDCE